MDNEESFITKLDVKAENPWGLRKVCTLSILIEFCQILEVVFYKVPIDFSETSPFQILG